ncbi:efflux RND transporter periplasmic adaptor subunit [Pseudoalteromonas sp. OOF1S-7]|uniref:efflux RND transporter periplasmic adaptor subunit n=1 Tax=Pseudoalteromonas sp. OOF1S-7 TaxID=2917757 RepID=UPI001EF529CD|nr:efflux RND transporter periplasmic adaptor subunit [Pseudoalteromonas sp. OOF1S-7]MCG7533838.1 efflux RND transporter periplasmic adaptor subunit [Pseudoalteromonas sp. OOF1S-7]
MLASQYKRALVTVLMTGVVTFSQLADAAQPVAVEPVAQGQLTSQLAVNGTLHGKRDMVITAGVSGRLQYVAEPGLQVAKGDVLVRMDTLPLELEKARQQEMLKRARINLRFQQQELTRLMELAKTSSTAASQVDKVQNAHDLVLSDIALAEVELRVIEDKLNRATVTAPFSGIVSKRYHRGGRDVSRADELLNLVDIDQLEARLYVPVKYLSYVRAGQQLPISAGNLDAPQTTMARVSAVIPATDPRSQTFEVRAMLDQPDDSGHMQHWAVGQLVDVSVPLVASEQALLVNRDALILRKQGIHVVKIDASNTATQIPVTVGKGQGQLVAITPQSSHQLIAGDRVAVRGAERLTDGQQVDVQN